MNKKKLNEWAGYPVDKNWTLAFRGSRDGFTGAKFHQYCDNKGETYIIIKSQNNYIFGGYAPRSWTGSSGSSTYINDAKAFIFTVKNPHNIQPTKYMNSTGNYSMYDNPSYLSTFGGGHDICVDATTCTVKFPHSYTDTTGIGAATFFGASSTTISEMEVFITKQ